jgi:16S rRNA U1498 N3-methylase RsmE
LRIAGIYYHTDSLARVFPKTVGDKIQINTEAKSGHLRLENIDRNETQLAVIDQQTTNAQSIKITDKLSFTPEGVFPNLIFNNGAIPSFDINK